MRDVIIAAGGYELTGRGASALRVLGMAALFRTLGYQPFVLGKFDVQPGATGPDRMELIDGIPCFDIRQPLGGRIYPSYITSAEPVTAIVDEVGAHRVRAILAYNYPARGAWRLLQACRARGIALVLDCTEWYGWEGRKILRNIWRQFGVHTRLRLLTRLAGNVICASTHLQRRLPGTNSLLLPFAFDTSLPLWERTACNAREDGPTRLVYSGSPGLGLHKDHLPPLIDALAALIKEGFSFECDIAGLTEDQYLDVIPRHRSMVRELGDGVRFHGRISHAESLGLIRRADFCLFFRKSNRVSNIGFPTKLAEAATLGVPVITNPTSDIGRYMEDGRTGILAAGAGRGDVLVALRRAVTMTPTALLAMKCACQGVSPFAMEHWTTSTGRFLSNLRNVHD